LVFRDAAEAISVITNGASIMFGGFAARGVATHLLEALLASNVTGITVIANGMQERATGAVDTGLLAKGRQVSKAIVSFPITMSLGNGMSAFEQQYRAGEAELETVPQGTLAERIRAGGAGIGAFYTPTGVGTPFAEGKEQRAFNGEACVLEYALRADFALVRAHKADELGNLVYRVTARNFNPIMASAAACTIVEVDELTPVGALDPEAVVTPGIFVRRIYVRGPHGS
jgi:3-oxoadipate CoA-transferase alpha subunit